MTVNVIAGASVIALLASVAALPAQGEAAQKQDRPYELMVGDPAPPLAIATWVKGDPVASLEQGKAYVVEFWATWCGPCVRGMPHLSELQKKYAQDVTIIGVNIWDDPAKVQPFMETDHKLHGKPGDEVMQYTVAIEEKIPNADPTKPDGGKMSTTWMKPAGRNGIPSAFIVDKQGKIAWIGHPAEMDKPLAEVAAGKFDLAKATKEYSMRVADQAKVEKYGELFGKGEYAAAYALGKELVKGSLAKDPNTLNQIAWGIVDPESKPKVQDLDLALAAAEQADKLTEHKNAHILDTLAHVYADRGELKKAVETQTMAVKFADDQLKSQLEAALKRFEKEAAAAEAGAKKDG
jgi:thiol-disulfide isomerase/thioredoxin